MESDKITNLVDTLLLELGQDFLLLGYSSHLIALCLDYWKNFAINDLRSSGVFGYFKALRKMAFKQVPNECFMISALIGFISFPHIPYGYENVNLLVDSVLIGHKASFVEGLNSKFKRLKLDEYQLSPLCGYHMFCGGGLDCLKSTICCLERNLKAANIIIEKKEDFKVDMKSLSKCLSVPFLQCPPFVGYESRKKRALRKMATNHTYNYLTGKGIADPSRLTWLQSDVIYTSNNGEDYFWTITSSLNGNHEDLTRILRKDKIIDKSFQMIVRDPEHCQLISNGVIVPWDSIAWVKKNDINAPTCIDQHVEMILSCVRTKDVIGCLVRKCKYYTYDKSSSHPIGTCSSGKVVYYDRKLYCLGSFLNVFKYFISIDAEFYWIVWHYLYSQRTPLKEIVNYMKENFKLVKMKLKLEPAHFGSLSYSLENEPVNNID